MPVLCEYIPKIHKIYIMWSSKNCPVGHPLTDQSSTWHGIADLSQVIHAKFHVDWHVMHLQKK